MMTMPIFATTSMLPVSTHPATKPQADHHESFDKPPPSPPVPLFSDRFCSAPTNWHTTDKKLFACWGDGGEEGKRWRGERLTSGHAANDVPGSASDSRGLARIHTEASFKRLDGRGVMPRLSPGWPMGYFQQHQRTTFHIRPLSSVRASSISLLVHPSQGILAILFTS